MEHDEKHSIAYVDFNLYIKIKILYCHRSENFPNDKNKRKQH